MSDEKATTCATIVAQFTLYQRRLQLLRTDSSNMQICQKSVSRPKFNFGGFLTFDSTVKALKPQILPFTSCRF